MSRGGVCRECDRPLVTDRCVACDGGEDAWLVRRELVGLLALAVVAVVGFLLTRTVAAANRASRAEDAARWHALVLTGQMTDPDDAIHALRRASSLDRGHVQYRFDLADALAERGEVEAARQLLLDIRESTPESPDVNTRLARLAAGDGRVGDAARYYQNAIHGVWPDDAKPTRRRLRIEPIRYLLVEGWRGRALAETIALSEALPRDVSSSHV